MAINISSRDHFHVSNKAKSRFRKSVTAPTTGCLEEQGRATAVNTGRSSFLGVFVKDLVSLARRTTYRPTGNRYAPRAGFALRWHRDGFRRYWALKCRKRGRPPIDPKIRGLIRRMCEVNPLWGAPRIHGELLKLGTNVSEAVVSKYMIRYPRPPSQTWRTFLGNHATDIFAIDFLTVPTATFRVLFVLVILSHDRRKIVHTNATEHPTAAWTARQVLEAIGTDDAPKFLLRDNDAIYGKMFRRKVAALGLLEVTTAFRSPWQNPYVERVIGSIRRECLNHTIIIGERHLRRVVANYVGYYNNVRTHMSLEKDAPDPRPIHGPRRGRIVRRPHCGGLHHEYRRKAA